MKLYFSRAIFIDGSQFTLGCSDCHSKVWVVENKNCPPQKTPSTGRRWQSGVVSHHKWPNEGSLSNWGWNGNECSAFQDLLLENVIAWYEREPKPKKGRLVFMQDGCQSHRATSTINFLKGHGFCSDKIMVWLSFFPDSNLFEKVWTILKREVWEWDGRFYSKTILWNAVDRESRSNTLETIRKLTKSMDTRLLKLINCEGKKIKYWPSSKKFLIWIDAYSFTEKPHTFQISKNGSVRVKFAGTYSYR